MKKVIIYLLFSIGMSPLFAQVGIGNVVPDTNSILDLTNTNNRGLILPSSPGILPTSANGILFWDATNNSILYRESGGYNSLSPWKYKFNNSISLNTYYTLGGNVGIGEDDPQVKLHLTENGRSLLLEGTSTSYLSFRPNGYNNDGADFGYVSSSNTLKIENKRLGNVEVTMNTNGASRFFDVTNGAIKQRGAELIPPGTIVMYYSSTAPPGWGICNGTNYNRADGAGTIQSPDLRDRFIVAAGSNMPHGKPTAANDGQNEIQLNSTHLPKHDHPFSGTTNSGGVHNHKMSSKAYDVSHNSSHGVHEFTYDHRGTSTNKDVYTANSSSHTHGFGGTTDETGNANIAPIDNRPEYYALTFIMKL